MAKQTGAVMLAFLGLTIGLALQLFSVSMTFWIQGFPTSDHSAGKDTGRNETSVSKGLWEICVNNNCNPLNKTIQPDWFTATQSLVVLGVGSSVAALSLYVVFLVSDRLRTSLVFHGFVVFFQLLAACSFVAAIAIFGIRAPSGTHDFGEQYRLTFGWSYYVGVGAAATLVIGLLASVRENCHLRDVRSAYDDL